MLPLTYRNINARYAHKAPDKLFDILSETSCYNHLSVPNFIKTLLNKMNFINPPIEHYIGNLYQHNDPVLKEMERLGAQLNFPIVGPLVGRLLYQLARLTEAKLIFEMGSGFGYSAYWFAKALQTKGRVHHTDLSESHCSRAKQFFEKANLSEKITVHPGNGIEIIDSVPGDFDIVFLDLEKEDYPAAYRKAKPRLKQGGLMIADNCLWSGRVLDSKPDAATRGILEFTRQIFSDKDMIPTLLPIRDGVLLAAKQ